MQIHKYTAKDEARKDQFKKELQIYTQELHADFEKIEQKRLDFRQSDIFHS